MNVVLSHLPGIFFAADREEVGVRCLPFDEHISVLDVISPTKFYFDVDFSSSFADVFPVNAHSGKLYGCFDLLSCEVLWSLEQFPRNQLAEGEERAPSFFAFLLPYPFIEKRVEKDQIWRPLNKNFFDTAATSKDFRTPKENITNDFTTQFRIRVEETRNTIKQSDSLPWLMDVRDKASDFKSDHSRAFPLFLTDHQDLGYMMHDWEQFLKNSLNFEATLSSFSKNIIPYFSLNKKELNTWRSLHQARRESKYWRIDWHRIKKHFRLIDDFIILCENEDIYEVDTRFFPRRRFGHGVYTIVEKNGERIALGYFYEVSMPYGNISPEYHFRRSFNEAIGRFNSCNRVILIRNFECNSCEGFECFFYDREKCVLQPCIHNK